MRNKGSIAALVVALLLFCGAGVARAEELCPGCWGGSGKMGCGGCTSAGLGAFIGRCSGCQGIFGGMNLRPGEQCGRCRGSGICQGCNGKGAPCLVCKGSGRVPDGTAKGIADLRAKAEKEGLEKQMKRLAFLVGRWKGEGEDREKGKYKIEMRWSTALDCLRHEERATFEDGSTMEFVGYVTWQESDSRFLWILAAAPGRILQFNGTPGADGSTIEFQFTTTDSRLARTTWVLKPDEKRFDGRSEAMEEGAWKVTGGSECQRTEAEPGDPIVETKGEPPQGNAATSAVNAGLKPLRSMVGRWKSQGEGLAGKSTGEAVWRARLGGTVLEAALTSKRPDGTETRERWFVTWDPESKRFMLCAFVGQGRVLVFFGTGNEAGDELTFDLDGPKLVWKLDREKSQNHWRVEVKGEDGGVKVVEKGVDTRE